jgi:hypothetical protein
MKTARIIEMAKNRTHGSPFFGEFLFIVMGILNCKLSLFAI